MKKVLILIISMLIIPSVYAINDFYIDVNKIDISYKSRMLLDNLDKEYNIDIKGFTNTEMVNKKAKNYTKDIINILFNSKNKKDREDKIHKEQYISSTNGMDTMVSLSMINMFLTNFENYNISYEYVKLIRTIEFSDGVITLSYFPNANVEGKIQDYILILWLKENKDGYKIYFPMSTKGEDLEDYFNSLGQKEDSNSEIGGSYKGLTIGTNKIEDEEVKKIYNDNINKNVSINAKYDGGDSVSGSGFFIRKGLVVTTWSLLLDMLNNSEYIQVSDNNKKSYNIDGIVAADTLYDMVVIKLKEEVGEEVVFSDEVLDIDDMVFSITSKNDNNFVINYGKNITNYNGKYKNMFAITNKDVGSAIYNKDGKVVGFNTNNSLNNDVSIANSTNYLLKLQDIFRNKEFKDIKSISFDDYKNNYYYKFEDEIINNIDSSIWNKYKNIGKIEDNIKLKLIKRYYKDNILSIRYKNEVSSYLDTFYFISDYEDELINEGYKLNYISDKKKVYSKGKQSIVIKSDLDYLIIIIMER